MPARAGRFWLLYQWPGSFAAAPRFPSTRPLFRALHPQKPEECSLSVTGERYGTEARRSPDGPPLPSAFPSPGREEDWRHSRTRSAAPSPQPRSAETADPCTGPAQPRTLSLLLTLRYADW